MYKSARTNQIDDEAQNFKGTLAEKAVKLAKLKLQQSARPTITCEGTTLDNVYHMKYLGSIFAADGDQHHDIKSKIARAFTRCGKLRNILMSPKLPTHLKTRLYQAAVVSLMTYGCETWDLNLKTRRQLVGANAKMLAWFTGQSIPQESRPATTSFNIVLKIRKQRLRWVGHLLRAGPTHLGFQALIEMKRLNNKGNLLMDTPQYLSLEVLQRKTHDRAAWRWREMVASLRPL